jgi:hypothetical protein
LGGVLRLRAADGVVAVARDLFVSEILDISP